MLAKYTKVQVNSFTRLVYLLRNIMLEMGQEHAYPELPTADDIHNMLTKVRSRPTSSEGLECKYLTPGEDNTKFKHLLTNLQYAFDHHREPETAAYFVGLLSQAVSYARDLHMWAAELFEQLKSIDSPTVTISGLKLANPKISELCTYIEHLYEDYRMLEIVIGEFYWSYEFNDYRLRRTYEFIQKIFWKLIHLAVAISVDNQKPAPGLDSLYLVTSEYNRNQSIVWNVGVGYVKMGQVINDDEYAALMLENTEVSMEEYPPEGDDSWI